MKKTISLLLSVSLIISCFFTLSSCTKKTADLSDILPKTDSVTFTPNSTEPESSSGPTGTDSQPSSDDKDLRQSESKTSEAASSSSSKPVSSAAPKPGSSSVVPGKTSSAASVMSSESQAQTAKLIGTVEIKVETHEKELFSGMIGLYEGDSAFSLLIRSCSENGIEVVQKKDPFLGSYYVKSIDGLAEKQISGSSGWVYEVNEKRATVSSASYIMKDRDSLVWKYTI